MCTSIIEIARAEGMAKRGDEWFPLSHAVVAYDHARHAPLGDVITLDFINTDLDPGARAGIELTLETAKELRAALDRADIAGRQHDRRLAVHFGWKKRQWRRETHHGPDGQVVGHRGDEIAILRQHLAPLLQRINDQPAIDLRAHRMKLELE